MSAPTQADRGYALFDTAIGRCGVAWSGRGLTAVHLPESDAPGAGAAERELRRFAPGPADPPPPVRAAAARMAALLEGAPDDLADIALDPAGLPEFDLRVYRLARAVPPGSTTTYGEIARLLGAPGAAQAVGRALARNPYPIVVPCHRVLAAGHRMGGFSAGGGTTTKMRMLRIEGAAPGGQESLF